MRNACRSPEDAPWPGPAPLLALQAAALALVVLLTVLGNLVVILAVAQSPALRAPTHALIANLAVADLLLGVAVLPLSAVREVSGFWLLGRQLCEAWLALDVLCCTASILSLCGISVDRYVGVSRPLAYARIMTGGRVRAMIAGVWVLALAISLAPLLGWRDETPPAALQCHVNKQLGYVIFSACGSFYVPAAVILVLYALVYRAAARHSRFLRRGSRVTRAAVTLRVHAGDQTQRVAGPDRPAGGAASFRREKKAAQTLGIVVGGFLLCWFPFFVVLPLDAACAACDLSGAPFTVTFWLGYCNSCLNPFIYACWSRELRQAFRAVACRRRPRPALAPSRPTGSAGRVVARNWSAAPSTGFGLS
ncbi:alpha-1A adrenergic receptor-like [Bacillus rossius redtenbacheri]|uniref:alpha-1A adrenergic receptor-like n=1 Tax=Bacillus rossius redtenbacheri TaxID=93214 RepID=UPI002FDDDE27